MKVLSLKEPYASLIKEKIKTVETRSWETNYRGKLYIHSSQSKSPINNERLKSLTKNIQLNSGHILCKCNLVDCIYMTKEYVEQMKKDNYDEYICGLYEEGRYAWILEDIVPLKEPIKAKGQLNIWNYYNELEVMELMKDIKYGWVDKDNNKYIDDFELFSEKYILQSPTDVIKNKVGVCWDQVELERYYFKPNAWNIKTFFLVHYDGDKCPTHTFLTFEKDNKHYWFEHSWEIFRGIHEYNTEKELLLDVRNKFIQYDLNNNYVPKNLALHQYTKPKYHISVQAFFNHCDSGEYIDLKNL